MDNTGEKDTRADDSASRQLKVSIGCFSMAGVKESNEDYVACYTPENLHELTYKGIAVALADGVSSAEAGKEASETAAKQFIRDYYQTPDTWSVAHAGQKVLSSINLRLFRQSHEFAQEEKGYLCTFSGMIIKSHTAHLFHVGDSRIYLLRDGELSLLTRDHVAMLGKGRSILARAVGMDNSLQIDYKKVLLQTDDIFLISSDGLHDFITPEAMFSQLDDKRIAKKCMPEKHLAEKSRAQDTAEALVNKALSSGSDDNISACVFKVEQLPKESLNEYNLKLTRLPFPPVLSPGMKLDGYLIKQELFASSRSQLYLVEEEASGTQMVMKTPSINYEDDTAYIDRFIQEEWIGKRIDSPYVVKIIKQKTKRNFLYYLMEYIEGNTLEKWMQAHRFPRPKLVIDIVDQIACGLKAFHNQETIHQDLKPANILLDSNNKVTIIDFGSVYVAGIAEVARPITHEHALGTASYSDPQYLLGKNSGIQGDIYSLATITYELFTGELPYGNKIEGCQSAHDYDRLRYRAANQFNPVIPNWFDRALQCGLAFDLEQRYRTIDAFLSDLHEPNSEYLLDDPKYTKDKSKAFLWQIISAVWLVTFILLYLLFSDG